MRIILLLMMVPLRFRSFDILFEDLIFKMNLGFGILSDAFQIEKFGNVTKIKNFRRIIILISKL